MSEKSTKRWSTSKKAFLGLWILNAVMGGLIYLGYRNERNWQAKLHPSFKRAEAQLRELADSGCQAPFKDCLEPFMARIYVLEAMDRENIAFGTRGMTPDTIGELEVRAEVLIASQKLIYLKTKGGVKLPSDLDLLEDICRQVYAIRRTLPGDNPTEAELKQLLPPGVAVKKPSYCWWGKD